jgi:hypothetical protein
LLEVVSVATTVSTDSVRLSASGMTVIVADDAPAAIVRLPGRVT